MMNGRGKSDSPVIPAKSPNQAEGPAAEATEGRGLAKGNSPERNAFRTQGRENAPSALERVRQAATKDKKQRFTALFHYIYDVERLRAAFDATKKKAAAGVDGETWEHYGENLETNLQDLSHRLQRGAYRAKPVAGCTSRRWVNRVSFAHSAFPRWKIRSSSVPPPKC
jgi:hypothetical protein